MDVHRHPIQNHFLVVFCVYQHIVSEAGLFVKSLLPFFRLVDVFKSSCELDK